MPAKPTGNKNGRPRKRIDWDVVVKLARILCTGEEIAAVVEVNYDTLNNHCKDKFGKSFSEWNKSNIDQGKASLRRMQFQTAAKGNCTMQIFLGKQYLGQRDKSEFEHTGADGGAILVNVNYNRKARHAAD